MRTMTLRRHAVALAFVLIMPAITLAQDIEALKALEWSEPSQGQIQSGRHLVRAIKPRCSGLRHAQPQAVALVPVRQRGRWQRVRGGRPYIPGDCIG